MVFALPEAASVPVASVSVPVPSASLSAAAVLSVLSTLVCASLLFASESVLSVVVRYRDEWQCSTVRGF